MIQSESLGMGQPARSQKAFMLVPEGPSRMPDEVDVTSIQNYACLSGLIGAQIVQFEFH